MKTLSALAALFTLCKLFALITSLEGILSLH